MNVCIAVFAGIKMKIQKKKKREQTKQNVQRNNIKSQCGNMRDIKIKIIFFLHISVFCDCVSVVNDVSDCVWHHIDIREYTTYVFQDI